MPVRVSLSTYYCQSGYGVSSGSVGQVKGYAMSQSDDGFLEFVLDQLGRMVGVRSRRMFGAYGLYRHDDFFAIVDGGRLYFRTSEATRPEYERRGMKPFTPTPKQVLKNYFEVLDVNQRPKSLVKLSRNVSNQGGRDAGSGQKIE